MDYIIRSRKQNRSGVVIIGAVRYAESIKEGGMTYTNGLEEMLDELLVKNFPVRISKDIREMIVKAAPWLLLLAGIFQVAFAWESRFGFLPRAALTGSIGILYLLAFPKVLKRQKSGWDLIYYACLLDLILALVETIRGPYFLPSLAGAMISQFIGFYLLFQVRSNYSKAKD